jgi:SAM-dependent methyltransferase
MDERFHPFERTVEDWHWWYQVRREILDQHLRKLALPGGARLLDIGCGTGGASLVMSRYGEVVGLDLAMRSFQLSMDRPYAHRVVGSAERLPFAERSFDAVAALDVLEHLDDDVSGAREVFRVLKPGGAAVVFVPALDILWGQNDEFSHHRRRYTQGQLERTLLAAGFTLGERGYFNLVLFLPLLAARLAERISRRTMAAIEYNDRPTRMNELLRRIFRLELPLLARRGMPLGTSVFCLAHRP